MRVRAALTAIVCTVCLVAATPAYSDPKDDLIRAAARLRAAIDLGIDRRSFNEMSVDLLSAYKVASIHHLAGPSAEKQMAALESSIKIMSEIWTNRTEGDCHILIDGDPRLHQAASDACEADLASLYGRMGLQFPSDWRSNSINRTQIISRPLVFIADQLDSMVTVLGAN